MTLYVDFKGMPKSEKKKWLKRKITTVLQTPFGHRIIIDENVIKAFLKHQVNNDHNSLNYWPDELQRLFFSRIGPYLNRGGSYQVAAKATGIYPETIKRWWEDVLSHK